MVQHAVEIDRPTNTGRMAAQVWSPSAIVPYAVHGQRADETELTRPEHDYLLLYPRAGAPELTAEMLTPAPGRERTLVILDGSWRQAAHMARRWASLRAMPCIALPPGPPSAWDIRQPRHPYQLCTLEAVIRVIAILGEEETARRLQEVLAMMNQGMRFMRGLRPRPPTWEEVREVRT